MEDFSHQFLTAVIPKIGDKYFAYEELYDLIKKSDPEDKCDDYFYQKLEFSYHLCKNYAEKWFHNVMLGDVSGNVLEEVMELNGFISINQQALQKIIFFHDLIFTTSKLFVSWRSDNLPFSIPPLTVVFS
jgi:SPX domain protein involved in polyphosphate accumulation